MSLGNTGSKRSGRGRGRTARTLLILVAMGLGFAMATRLIPPPLDPAHDRPVLDPYGQAGLLVGLNSGDSGPRVAPGKPVPDFELADVNGDIVRFSSLRGRAVVLNFWATWCPPCTAEMPLLQSIHDRERANKLIVVGVNVGEPLGVVVSFLNRHQLTYPVWVDPPASEPPGGASRAVFDALGAAALPTTLYIDPDGILLGRALGELTPLELDRMVSRLLNRSETH